MSRNNNIKSGNLVSSVYVSLSQAALKEAKESLDETLRILNEAKARLREVEEGLAALQSKYEECVAKKEELKDKCQLCEARLQRAEKVLKCKLVHEEVLIFQRLSFI